MLSTTSDTGQSKSDFLRAWQQGDYTCDCKDFVLMDQTGAAVKESGFLGAACSNPPVGAVVISQTCDLVRPKAVVPYVIVCPLVHLDDEAYRNMEKGKTPRLGFLPAVRCSKLAVDFSRTMSVAKEALSSWTRKQGCKTEEEQMNFADAIEGFFGRFPFPDDFIECLRPFRGKLFSKYNKPHSSLGRVLQYLEEIRIAVETSRDESDNEVKRIAFLCILPTPRDSKSRFSSDEEASSVQTAHIEKIEEDEIREQLLPIIKAISWKSPYELDPKEMYLRTLDEISAVDYLSTYSLDVNAMSPIS